MVTTHKYNPILKSRLLAQVQAGSAEGLDALLRSLSVAEFRTACYQLAEDILLGIESEQYWHFFMYLVPPRSKVYLGLFLKAAVKLYRAQSLRLDEGVLAEFASQATPIDVRKTLERLLPEVSDPVDMQLLVRVFCQNQLEQAAPHLVRAGTPTAYYQLFCLLKTAESDRQLLHAYASLLLRKADSLSFNMTSIIRQYFDLQDIPGRFSLQLEPYELSRLDQGAEYFFKILQS